MTRRYLGSLASSVSWMESWYLFMELKGISTILAFLFLLASTSPSDNSTHFSNADSEASPGEKKYYSYNKMYIGRKKDTM